ncbi:MAG: Rieske 2Fe-2S domain-containing protein [Planctomycetaceae bacterium]|nr:Rieske 2Fe-2S domain-containing protein [Planctomycetaceae bacterium]
MLIADTEQLSLGPADDIRVGTSQVFFVEGREISVFRRETNWFAIDNHCPHSGASLAAGKCGESVVTCGWHHWQFDLRTGEAIGRPGFKVGTHALEVRDGELWITLSSEPEIIHQHEVSADSGTPSNAVDEAVDWREASRCLVRYGAMTWTGYFRFRSNEPLECRHGERVLIETPRGIEVGEALSPLTTDPPRNDVGKIIKPTGELLRKLTSMESFEHVRRQRDARLQSVVQELLAECSRRIAERGIAVDVVDGELLFHGKTLVLYFLGTPTDDLGVLASELSQAREFNVIFNSVLEVAAPVAACGCSGGGCSAK